jgi:hypothetical protein
MVTGFVGGNEDGAVYVVVDPLAVVVRLKVPHAPVILLPQLAVQSTPAFVESPVTVAASVDVLPSAKDIDGVRVIVTLMTVDVLMVAWAETLVVPSATAVAMMVTIPPAGALAGAV